MLNEVHLVFTATIFECRLPRTPLTLFHLERFARDVTKIGTQTKHHDKPRLSEQLILSFCRLDPPNFDQIAEK